MSLPQVMALARAESTGVRHVALILLGAAALGCGGLVEPLMFAVDPSELELRVGETATISVTVLDGNGDVVTDRAITFTSRNELVATVNSAGVVQAVGAGSASITIAIASPPLSGSVPVTVIPTATGDWSGSVQGSELLLTLHLTESPGGSITGTGSFSVGAAAILLGVDGNHDHPVVVLNLVIGREIGVTELHSHAFSPALDAAALTGVLDQDPAHRLAGGVEEMAPVVPGWILATHETPVGLMHQGCGLQGVVGALVLEMGPGEDAQLVVDQGEQALERLLPIRTVEIAEDAANAAFAWGVAAAHEKGSLPALPK